MSVMLLAPIAQTDEISSLKMDLDIVRGVRSDINSLIYRNETTQTWGHAGPPFNLSHAVILELNRRIDAGLLIPQYRIQTNHGRLRVYPNQVPAHLQWIVDRQDPFKRIDASSTSEVENIGPRTEFWFKRGTTAPTVPSLSTFDYVNNTTVAQLMDADGWSKTTPSGTDTLYWTRVTWSVVSDVSSASASTPDTDDIRYSTDGGGSFSDTPPADMNDVDALEIYQPGYGWIEYPLHEDVVNPLIYISGANWQNYNNGADNADQYINISSDTDLLEDNYAVGFTVDTKISWSDHNTQVMGSASMPVKLLKTTKPNDVVHNQNAGGHVGKTTYMLAMNREHGGLELGLSAPDSLTSDYDSTYWSSFKFCFVSFPQMELTEAVTDSATVVYLSNKEGLSTGDTLFIDDEQMIVNVMAINPETGHGGGYSITVTRATGGTTAAAHDNESTVRGIVNKNAVRHVCITHRNGVPDYTQFRIFRLRKRGAE